MWKRVKTISALVAIILATLSLYYGAFLPYRKAKMYASAEATLNTGGLKTYGDFERIFETMFALPSPVGGSEAARFLGNRILNLLSQKPPENVARVLKTYAEEKLKADVTVRLGLSRTQGFALVGHLNALMWARYRDTQAFNEAVRWYKEGLALSPNRPEFLYGLFGLHNSAGRAHLEEAINAGEAILALWPHDESVRAQVERMKKEITN